MTGLLAAALTFGAVSPAAVVPATASPATVVPATVVPTTASPAAVVPAPVVPAGGRPGAGGTAAAARPVTTDPATTDPATTADNDPDPGAPGPAPGVRQREQCAPAPSGTAAGTGRGDPLAAVHRLADGTGQRIAVIDTGVTPHPRLSGRLTGGGDYVEGGDGLDDCDGHGTEVAGLLAAAPDPATRAGGGIAPGAQLVSLRQSSARFTVTGPDGQDRPAGEIGTLAAAITRAVALGATVVNISEVVCVPADRAATAGEPLRQAVRRATDAGVVVVAAAGNADPSGTCTGAPDLRPMPALFDDVIAVGAVDDADRPAGFSLAGDWVDVAAPGVDVRPSATGGGTGPLSGTSYAAPVVAGVAALLRERFPSLTPDQIADRLRATARHPARGRDDRVGHGVVDPVAALTAEPLLLSPGPQRADGPRTGGRTAELPGLDRVPAGHTPAVLGGLLVVLALVTTTAAALRRLRPAPGTRRGPSPDVPAPRPARDPRAGVSPARPRRPGPSPGPAPPRGAAAATPPPEPARRP